MTLATILYLCIVAFTSARLGRPLLQTAVQTSPNQTQQDQAHQNQAGGAQPNQNAGSESPAQVPPASQGQTSGTAATNGQKKRSGHKKKATSSASPDCQPA